LHRHHLWECVRDAALWLSPCWRSELPLRQRRDAALVKSVGEVMAKPVVVDSSKVALRLKYLLRNPGLNVSVVHLIRDGRAVALTYMDQRQFGGGMTPIPSTDGRCIDVPMEEAARRWRRSNEEAECVLARLDPSRWSRVRYEDYAAEPRRVLEELFEFLGLDPAQATLNFRSDGVHVIGNVMRLDTSREITVDDRWRRVLTVDQLAAFDRAAGRLNRRYGYE
jgi:hypothetical protein